MTVKDLTKAHESILRNKLIANAFYVRGLIEKWGTDTNKMISLCKADGLAAPEFAERNGGLAVMFRFAESIVPEIKGDIASNELTQRQHEILEIIKKYHTVNIKQIIKELKEPPSRTMIKRDLDAMKRKGLVRIQGAARNAVWVMN